jgi:hypothetical protein
VISTKLFVGVFVALYASVISAIPTYAVASNTTALEPRQTPPGYYSHTHMCDHWTLWLRRECTFNIRPTSWRDHCLNSNNVETQVPGFPDCPEGTFCDDIWVPYNGRVVKTIQCLPKTNPGVAQSRKQSTDPQAGSSGVKEAVISRETSTLYHQLVIADDMLASVSAFFMSEFLTLKNCDWCANGNIT